MTVKKAVIPAAGLGTRMLPAAKSIPKEMITIVDRPAIHYIVDEIVKSGITDILIITARGKSPIEDYFDCSFELEEKLKRAGKEEFFAQMKAIGEMANIFYVRQGDNKGLGHAVYQAKAFVGNEPFALLLGDDVVYTEGDTATKQLCDAYERCGKTVLGVQKVAMKDVSKYGNIKPANQEGKLMQVLDMVEKPKPEEAFSPYAALGRYVLTPDVFTEIEKTGPGAGGEIQLTDALKRMAPRGGLFAYDFAGRRYDTGNKNGYLESIVEYGLRNPETADGFRKYLKTLMETL